MIFLSVLTKAFALALFHTQPGAAATLWLLGLLVDVRMMRQGGLAKAATRVVLYQALALAVGWSALRACDYAAMRWKDGFPLLADVVAWVVNLSGQSASANAGIVSLTTMAGPLDYAASIDLLGLRAPLLFLVMAAVWLLWSEASPGEVVRRLLGVAGLLLVVTVLRMAFVVLAFTSLCEFISYESEELPYRPFMSESAAVWIHLPFLLLAGVLIGRRFRPPSQPAGQAREIPRWLKWAAFPALLALAFLICWQPAGTPKSGRVVISTWHSEWSRCDRPYDRDWYGADSGYNYACMRRLFERFYPTTIADGPLTAATLQGASMLVIYDPDKRFSSTEIELIHEFVREGGGLFVIGDHTNVFGSTSHLNELCEPFGFRIRDDVLFDLDEDFHQMMDPPAPAPALWHGITFFKLRGPTSIQPTSVWTRPVYEVGHSKSVRAIYSVNNFYPPPHDDPKMKSGTFCVSATSRYGRGRVVAWADSTVFSNFEIFYPGKYEYLLNTLDWLNHRDTVLASMGARIAGLALLAGLAFFVLRHRDPRAWLVALALAASALGVARLASGFAEQARTSFPAPRGSSDWVFFAAHAGDKGHHLRDFITEEPYDQRYEVFTQWVLRTGAWSAFHLLDPGASNALHKSLLESDGTAAARALIVRKPDDLPQLSELAAVPSRDTDPLLLMFAATIPVETAVEAVKEAGLLTDAGALAQMTTAWPAGEVLIQDGRRRVLIVAAAERFSDQSMGISEKITPDPNLRKSFDQAFGLIDRLFGHETAPQN